MSVLQMSFTASILIIVIIIIRALTINKLPKKTFLAFWAIALVRLLIPFSFSSPLSLYSIISNNAIITETMIGTPAANILPMAAPTQMPSGDITTTSASPAIVAPSLWAIIWIIGVTLCALYFVIAYTKCYKGFQTSTIVKNDFVTAWLAEHKIVRPISIRQSSRISTPLTYGIFRPVILIPQNIDWSDKKPLQYIFAHEYAHIRHFDAITKLFLTAALCIHWFNPLVWAMYILSNRDIEISCDEAVVYSFGEEIKSSYARVLVSMEERKSTFTPYYNSFSKNAIEERIIAIMKTKKSSLTAVLVAAIMVVGVTTVFATSATVQEDNLSTAIPKTDFRWPFMIFNEQNRKNETAQIFEVYRQYGLVYDKGSDRLYYNDELVRYFEDIESENYYKKWPSQDGNLDIYAVRNAFGELTGVEPFSQQEFDERTAFLEGEIFALQITNSITITNTNAEFESDYSSGNTYYSDEMEQAKRKRLEQVYSIYQQYGLTYDKESDRLYYKGSFVGYFEDKAVYRYFRHHEDGYIDIYAIRDDAGNLTGLEVIE